MTPGEGQWPAHCRAFVVDKTAGGVLCAIRAHPLPPAGDGDLLIRVAFSALNYKDALVVRGARGIACAYPHVPGIDAAGVVVASRGRADWVGQRVLVTGFGFGVDRPGGFADYAVVPQDWVIPIPASLSTLDSMIFGTAGLTAGLCAQALIDGGVQAGDAVLVTGATGAVGSQTVAILAAQGLRVTAASRKAATAYLQGIGAHEVCLPDSLATPAGKALVRARWRGAVDTVGGKAIEDILKQIHEDGVFALCGMAGGTHFSTSVFPFILRGVRLAGIDSVRVPIARRHALWQKLAGPWRPAHLADLATIVPLSEVPTMAERLLSGTQIGRVVVRMEAAPAPGAAL
ncbi:MAG: YhdH/YhfP family quinone oxidoreductase [Gammaproteobacteria bacterium]|nr:YhdH/YhfP family quinone oxidoreductase [Gammaproteobacteria bacterium]